MKSLLVGVLGHADHGKTALVRALTGTQADRLREERERGVPRVPGSALLRVPGGAIDLVDLPGHPRFVRAMVGGATGLRAVLLAVDAREGVRPQTLEHLEIARLIGVRRGVIALTKCDLVPAAEAEARAAQAAAAAAAAGLEGGAPVRTSALRDQGLAELRARLAALLDAAGSPTDDGSPYLPVDRVFTRPGAGPVLAGALRRGGLAVGDAVAPEGCRAMVRAPQVHGRPAECAEPGRRNAAALHDRALAVLADHHRARPLEPGLTLGCLALLLGADEAAAAAVLRDLVAARDVVQDQALFRHADRDTARPESELVQALEAQFRRAGLTPPDEVEAVGRDVRRAEALAYLIRAGTLVRAVDRVQRRAIIFHRDAVEGARRTLVRAFDGSAGFLAREAGAVLGISRKFSIPLLEHFDAQRITRRFGDTRTMTPQDPAGEPGGGVPPAP
ncbi:Elongation factor Tu [Methylobacterium crusticola]|uniref:Elongation factor Tu n=1 Tax=Methylobacterium crusticola TaxID=1697972 RepID=A0ABQ4R9M0_9HYPH|nr:SelB C-terminal domain-containing protein [Methylobacterium crusticola]GJD53939.1 Elongation factor Tu [Methylobacterium crusticola]